MKCRYATVGRATKWLTNGVEQIEQDIDCMPVGVSGPVQLYIFWDSQQNNKHNSRVFTSSKHPNRAVISNSADNLTGGLPRQSLRKTGL